MNLGDLGTVREPEDDSFGYYGADIRVHPEFGELVFSGWVGEFGALDSEDSENVVKGATAAQVLMSRVIHEDDFDTFWKLTLKNRQTTVDLMGLVSKIVEAQADRPTKQSSDSSVGRKRTAASSKAVSSSVERLEDSGRPDLALVHEQALESRAV